MKVKCIECNKSFNFDPLKWKCDCGGFFDVLFTPSINIVKVKERNSSFWRYSEALPLEHPAQAVSLRESLTPLVEDIFRRSKVMLKLENNLPSGSFKDRGAAVMMSALKEKGVKEIIEDSSGNAGCAVALYAAKANIDCTVFVPANVDEEKVSYIENVGGDVKIVSTSRADTTAEALKASENICYASHVWNPWFLHGVKTCAYEICEQTGWSSPSKIFFPAGNGTLLLGLYMGFSELVKAGVLFSLPQLVPVQSENCCPLYDAFHKKKKSSPYKTSVAKGISIENPHRLKQMIKAVEVSQGTVVKVSDELTASIHSELKSSGYYVDMSAAVGMAGFASSPLKNDSLVVITGSLKKTV